MSIGDDLLEHQDIQGDGDCSHDEGHREQRYDADGCGFYVWVCDACACEWFDDLP